jgi:uncharacterized protein involved in exopolysaccharide biosynthesis
VSVPAGPLPTLEGITAFVRRHVAVILALTVLGAAVGWLTASMRPDRYASTAMVLLPAPLVARDLGGANEEPAETLDTLARLAYSAAVVEDVARSTGVSEDEAVAGIDVSAVPLSRLLVIEFVGDSREQARLGAQAAAESVIVERERVFGLGGTVAQAAIEPRAPEQSNTEVWVVSAALLGLLLGVGASVVRDGLTRPPSPAPTHRSTRIGDPRSSTEGR